MFVYYLGSPDLKEIKSNRTIGKQGTYSLTEGFEEKGKIPLNN